MIVSISNAATAAMKRQKRYRASYIRFRRAMQNVQVREVNPEWFMASGSGLVAFGTTAEIAKGKVRAAIRRQFLTPLTVQGGEAA